MNRSRCNENKCGIIIYPINYRAFDRSWMSATRRCGYLRPLTRNYDLFQPGRRVGSAMHLCTGVWWPRNSWLRPWLPRPPQGRPLTSRLCRRAYRTTSVTRQQPHCASSASILSKPTSTSMRYEIMHLVK